MQKENFDTSERPSSNRSKRARRIDAEPMRVSNHKSSALCFLGLFSGDVSIRASYRSLSNFYDPFVAGNKLAKSNIALTLPIKKTRCWRGDVLCKKTSQPKFLDWRSFHALDSFQRSAV